MNVYETLLNPKALPVPKAHCRAHYEGSIDKTGGNADWDWNLYQDENGEWVLFEHLGPGCIYNFVQHRYPSCEEPAFSFYFDGEKTPRFTIRHSQFGEKYPFVEPLASRYIGPYDNGRGPIRVVRSFVPMPYQKSCRITSSICLKGFDRTKNEGGWGHVIYHAFEFASLRSARFPSAGSIRFTSFRSCPAFAGYTQSQREIYSSKLDKFPSGSASARTQCTSMFSINIPYPLVGS